MGILLGLAANVALWGLMAAVVTYMLFLLLVAWFPGRAAGTGVNEGRGAGSADDGRRPAESGREPEEYRKAS